MIDANIVKMENDSKKNIPKENKVYNILIADDEEMIRTTIESMLGGRFQCKVFHAGNGMEALDIVNTVDFDLIILDLLMPGEHGFNICSAIRGKEDKRHVPILVMSAIYTKMKYFHQAKECGATGYITKPFTMETLIKEVQRLLTIPSQAGTA